MIVYTFERKHHKKKKAQREKKMKHKDEILYVNYSKIFAFS